MMLEQRGLRNKNAKPALSDLYKYRNLRMRESLPKASVIALVICALLAVWSTYEVTMNEENLKFKGVAEDCQYDPMEGYVDSEGKSCFVEMNIWDNVWDRSIRGWLFSGIIAMLAIVKVPQPKVADMWEEE